MAQQDIWNFLFSPANCPTEPTLVWPEGPNEPELAELAEGRGKEARHTGLPALVPSSALEN